MQRILRYLAPLALLIAALALVACGGDDEGSGGGGTALETEDPTTILEQTFASAEDRSSESGRFDLTLNVAAEGGGTPLENPIEITVGGPFQSQGDGQVPALDIDFSVTGVPGMDSIEAGITSTGDKGFVNYMGTEYVVSDEVFQQFTMGYEQQEQSQPTLESLGITPQDWIADPQVEDSEVGGVETAKVTGAVDLPAMLADVNKLLGQAGSLGIPNTGGLPTELTEQQIQMVEEAVTEANVEIESGKDDSILRRFAFVLAAEDPSGSGGTIDLDFDLTLTELNEDQEIAEPSDAQPFDELLGQLGGLGGIGALGGAGTAGAGAGGAGAAGGVSDAQLQCLEDAGSDTDAAAACLQG